MACDLMSGAGCAQQWTLRAATLRGMRAARMKVATLGRRERRWNFAVNRIELPFAVR
jgi:hypothetical protein